MRSRLRKQYRCPRLLVGEEDHIIWVEVRFVSSFMENGPIKMHAGIAAASR